jgi:H+-translocating diphosphatase
MAAVVILTEPAMHVIIPITVVVGIDFAVLQWVLVSKVRLSPERRTDDNLRRSGPSFYLIEEEEGLNDHNIVVKCVEIQSAISEGEMPRVLVTL